MNNKLPNDWQSLVADAKSGLGSYDAAIIAADELIKEQQAEIEHYNNQLDRACGDGNTPADFDKLRDANLSLAMESHQQQAHIERLRECLSCLIENSDGVAGLHLNGEIAPWDSLSAGGHFEEWLFPFSETPAQSLEALKREWQVETKGHHALVLTNARRLIKAHKSTSNARLCSDIFGMGCGSGRQYCRELGLDPDSNETNFTVMIDFIEGNNND